MPFNSLRNTVNRVRLKIMCKYIGNRSVYPDNIKTDSMAALKSDTFSIKLMNVNKSDTDIKHETNAARIAWPKSWNAFNAIKYSMNL